MQVAATIVTRTVNWNTGILAIYFQQWPVSEVLPNVRQEHICIQREFYAGLSIYQPLSATIQAKSLSVSVNSGEVVPPGCATQQESFSRWTRMWFTKPSGYVEKARPLRPTSIWCACKRALWLGGSYRTGDSFVALIGTAAEQKTATGLQLWFYIYRYQRLRFRLTCRDYDRLWF